MTEKGDQANIIGRNIDRLLYENRTTQAELAEAIGLSASAVGKWVLGHGALVSWMDGEEDERETRRFLMYVR